jgi:hypothetical protein
MFNPGDILLYTSPGLKFNNLISNGIRLIQGSKVSHVALYVGANERGHVILEALSDGVNLKTLVGDEIYNRKLKPADGLTLCGIARLPNIKVSLGNTVFAIASAKYTQSPYGYLTDVNILLQHGKTRIFPKKPWTVWFKSKKGYICSEVAMHVIQDVLQLYNMPIPFKKIPALTEPDDYLIDPWEVIEL